MCAANLEAFVILLRLIDPINHYSSAKAQASEPLVRMDQTPEAEN